MTPECLEQTVEEFLGGSRSAVVMEDGEVVFDLEHAKYSISGEYNKCLLHLWSAERNVVRRVLELELRNDTLKLVVQRLGQARPNKLEICRERDRRTPSTRRAARLAYRQQLQRLLERRFPEYAVVALRASVDLERSFGPVHARGLLRRGQTSFAVLGVNSHESQASIDATLTFGILWLDVCRENSAGKAVVEGLKVIVPAGRSALVRERMAQLNHSAAKWQLYEFDECEDSFSEVDISDRGNIATRLVQRTDEASTRKRFLQPIAHIRALMPEVEVAVLSSAEVAFRLYGLEFVRARLAYAPGSLRGTPEVVFGVGAYERVLDERNEAAFVELVRSLGEARHSQGPRDHPLWRLHPERWLESLIVKNVSSVDERLDPTCVYSQVPAFSASDRAMIDVLTATREGRLAVVELKADEDIHLPLQGLDYWSRVAWHHERGEFQRFGYFPGRQLSGERPLLFLVAPALHVHPATDTLLHYISPDIEWTVVGMDERWRERQSRIFHKRPAREISLQKQAKSA